MFTGPRRSTYGLARLKALTRAGDLSLAYVLGVTRSNSTIAARLVGRQLDGAVLEPAVPSTAEPELHYEQTILSAYEAARLRVGAGRPVALVIKDISGFLTPAMEEFALGESRAVLFTTREPHRQHASLTNQFAHEFSPMQRLDAIVRYPYEQLWFTVALARFASHYMRVAREALAPHRLGVFRTAVLGFNLDAWQRQSGQFDAIAGRDIPVEILDAGLMRAFPQLAEARLENFAAATGVFRGLAEVETAAHSRMLARSRWAGEARTSIAIKPLMAEPDQNEVPDWLRLAAATLKPHYDALFNHPRHAMRSAVQGA
jgi:hypothetical protein